MVDDAGAIWHRALKSHQAREERVAPAEDYRGVSVSLGPLPLPQVPFSKNVTLRSTNESLKALSDDERILLDFAALGEFTDVIGRTESQCLNGHGRLASSGSDET